MPKLIDYPRTSYNGAWELAEVVDDTGSKCAIETAAKKLDRKVSGSFKAIIGSAVKFGLLTSKRELLSTTTLYKRIKHAYDKQEEILFHREAFLTPPLFTQLCRKFRSRELPIQMLDVMLIREFAVEEINAQGVAKAFVEGGRMVGLLDEHNIVADIDAPTRTASPRRELSSLLLGSNAFRTPSVGQSAAEAIQATDDNQGLLTEGNNKSDDPLSATSNNIRVQNQALGIKAAEHNTVTRSNETDAIASLFNLSPSLVQARNSFAPMADASPKKVAENQPSSVTQLSEQSELETIPLQNIPQTADSPYVLKVTGAGVNTTLDISEEADLDIALAMLEKIRRQLRASR